MNDNDVEGENMHMHVPYMVKVTQVAMARDKYIYEKCIHFEMLNQINDPRSRHDW